MEELLKELEEAKQKIAEIEKKIEEKKAETGRWKPRTAEEYWWTDSVGLISRGVWEDDGIDNGRWRFNNCYQTKEEANFAIEKSKVIAELKEFEEPKDRKWDRDNFHYFIYYDIYCGKVSISECWDSKLDCIYFESRKKAQQAIDAVGEERIKKYYLEVEE